MKEFENIIEHLNYQIDYLTKWEQNDTLSEFGKGKLDAFCDVIERIEALTIPIISQRRELLKAFQEQYESDNFDDEMTFDWNIDNFLKTFNPELNLRD